jgi:hypothetical protein
VECLRYGEGCGSITGPLGFGEVLRGHRHAARLTLDPHAALRCATQALDLATRSGAAAQIAASLQATGRALLTLGRLDEAAAPASRAAETFKTLGDIDSYVQCLSLIGFCRRDEGRRAYARAAQVFKAIDDAESGSRCDALATP